MFWGGGLRGALPLVLALSIPVTFLQRQLVLDLTAGVVLFSLLVQGMSVGRLIRSVQPGGEWLESSSTASPVR